MLSKTCRFTDPSRVQQTPAFSCGCVQGLPRIHRASATHGSACKAQSRPEQHNLSILHAYSRRRASVPVAALGNGANGNGKSAAGDAGVCTYHTATTVLGTHAYHSGLLDPHVIQLTQLLHITKQVSGTSTPVQQVPIWLP